MMVEIGGGSKQTENGGKGAPRRATEPLRGDLRRPARHADRRLRPLQQHRRGYLVGLAMNKPTSYYLTSCVIATEGAIIKWLKNSLYLVLSGIAISISQTMVLSMYHFAGSAYLPLLGIQECFMYVFIHIVASKSFLMFHKYRLKIPADDTSLRENLPNLPRRLFNYAKSFRKTFRRERITLNKRTRSIVVISKLITRYTYVPTYYPRI